MSNQNGEPGFILGAGEDERLLEEGIYPVTVTSERRYTDEASVDYIIYDSLSRVLEDQSGDYTILDVGSSSGEALESLVERFEDETDCDFETIALDIDEKMVVQCYEEMRHSVLRAAAQDIPVESDSIDIVVSSQLHLNQEDIEDTVEEVNRVLHPEGYAVLTTGYEKAEYWGIHHGKVTSKSESLPQL